MREKNMQEKAKAAYGTAITRPAEQKAGEALSKLEQTVIEAASKAEPVAHILQLDTDLTKNWYALKFGLIKPRDFLNFQPYQELWDELERQGLQPHIRLNWYSDHYSGFSWSFPAIWVRVPR